MLSILPLHCVFFKKNLLISPHLLFNISFYMSIANQFKYDLNNLSSKVLTFVTY